MEDKMNNLTDRVEAFRREVEEVGGLTYTKEMLENFFLHWSEHDRSKVPLMKWEKELKKKNGTWETSKRLAYWARRNYDNIQCYLSESQKTLKQKRQAFAISLEKYLPIYGRDMLNSFYAHYTMPENTPNPKNLCWESFEFWSLETKLKQWKERSEQSRF